MECLCKPQQETRTLQPNYELRERIERLALEDVLKLLASDVDRFNAGSDLKLVNRATHAAGVLRLLKDTAS